jgi:hypothetical protein
MATLDRFRVKHLPLVAAIIGALVGFAALVRPWATITYSYGDVNQSNHVPVFAGSAGTGDGYLITLVALIATLTVAIFTLGPVRLVARLASFGLTAAAAGIVGTGIFRLSDSDLVRQMYGAPDNAIFKVDLASTIWLAPIAVVMLAAAAWLAAPVDEIAAEDDDYEDDEPEYGDGIEVIDLTVKAG